MESRDSSTDVAETLLRPEDEATPKMPSNPFPLMLGFPLVWVYDLPGV